MRSKIIKINNKFSLKYYNTANAYVIVPTTSMVFNARRHDVKLNIYYFSITFHISMNELNTLVNNLNGYISLGVPYFSNKEDAKTFLAFFNIRSCINVLNN